MIEINCFLIFFLQPGKSVTLIMHPPSSQSTSKSTSTNRSSSPNPQASSIIELILHQTTPQDVICELGAPQSIHWREDDRLSIHSQFTSSNKALEVKPGEGSTETDGRSPRDTRGALFYNYFALGFDLMFSGPSSRSGLSDEDLEADLDSGEDDLEEGESTLMKVILHGNVPGSALFGRYGRCCWEIGGEGEEKVGFDSKVSKKSETICHLFHRFDAHDPSYLSL